MSKNKKQIGIIIALLILLIGGSYAWLKLQVIGNKTNVLRAGTLDLVLDDTKTNGISIEKAVPMSDTKGKEQEGYTFELINKGTMKTGYTIYIDDLPLETNETRMNDKDVKYSLIKNGEEISTGVINEKGENPNRKLEIGEIDGKTTNKYVLKVWMNEEATNDAMGTIFYATLRIEAHQDNVKHEESDTEIDTETTKKVPLKEGESGRDFIFESSDEEVVKVDEDGNLDIVGPGMAIITKTDKKTGEIEKITVKAKVPITATFGEESLTCNLEKKGQTTCEVSAPGYITGDEEIEFIGWNKDKTSHDGVTKDEKVEISKDDVYYPITKRKGKIYKATFSKPSIGVESISNTSLSCTIPEVYNEEEQSTSCKIKLPTINTKAGYTAVGWNEDKNATTGALPDTEIDLTGNKEFYGIVKKDAITLSAKFYKNGSTSQDGDTSEYITKSCELKETYNVEAQDVECEIVTPTIEASVNTPIVVGYSEEQNATVANINPNTTIKLSGNKTYYAITKSDIKTITATFYKNGAATLDNSEDSYITKQCNILGTYNGQAQDKSCNITSPTIKASTNTPTVIGYSTSEDSHQSEWDSNTEKGISESKNYYAQTKKDKVSYVATYKVGKNVVSVGKESDVCEIPEAYNGNVQNTSCNVTGPSISPKTGYTSVGYSKTSGSTTGTLQLELTKDETYYANAVANSYKVEYYADSTKLGESGVKVDDELTLTTISSLNGEKTGYSFKGWTRTNGSQTVEYTDGSKVTNLATQEGEVVKLYAIYVDETKPVCTFQESLKTTVNKSENITLVCTDLGSGVKSVNLSTSNFTVSNSNGSVTSVTSPTAVTNGYKYVITTKGLSVGEYTISLKSGSISDNAGNSNDVVTSSPIKVEGITYTATFTKNGTGVASIGSTSASCTTTGSNTECSVTAPAINVSSGYTAIGWNTTSTATSGVAVGGAITLSKNTTYYSIASKKITITFNKNGAASQTVKGGSASTANTVTQSCTMYNSETSCSITSPTIAGSTNTPTVIGYSTAASTHSSSWNQNTAKNVSSNATYYAQTKKDATTYTANWNSNGASLSFTTSSSCTIAEAWNGTSQGTSCTVRAPTITRGEYNILGFNTSSSATTATVSSGGTLTLTSSNTGSTWYAITNSITSCCNSFGDAAYNSCLANCTGSSSSCGIGCGQSAQKTFNSCKANPSLYGC